MCGMERFSFARSFSCRAALGERSALWHHRRSRRLDDLDLDTLTARPPGRRHGRIPSGQFPSESARPLALPACFRRGSELSRRLIDGIGAAVCRSAACSFLAGKATPAQRECSTDRMLSSNEGIPGVA